MEKKGKKWTRASKDCIKLNKEIETELDIYESKNLKDKEADGDNYKAPFPNNIDTMANLDFYYCYKFYVCDQYYDLLKGKIIFLKKISSSCLNTIGLMWLRWPGGPLMTIDALFAWTDFMR